MNADSGSDHPFIGGFPVDSGTPLNPSSELRYEGRLQKFRNPEAADHDMELSAPPSPPSIWSTSSSTTTPETPFDGFRRTAFPERFIQYTPMEELFAPKGFDMFPGFLDMKEASSSKAGQLQVGGQSPHFRLLSPFGYDSGIPHLHGDPVLQQDSHEQQERLLSGTDHYPMMCNIQPVFASGDPDGEKSLGTMRFSRIEGSSQVVGDDSRAPTASNRKKRKPYSRRAPAAGPRASTSGSGSISQQIAPNDIPPMQDSTMQMSSTSLMPERGLANADTQSIVDPDRWLPTRDTFKARSLPKHDLTTFRNLEEGNVSGGVFVNSSAPVIVNTGVSPRPLPPDKDCNCVAGATDIHSTHDFSSTIIFPESPNPDHSEYEIYFKYLSVKKRGFPLWKPGPQLRLPLDYRKYGVSHGDVGVLNATTGTFSFLFNIFLPADHEINRWGGVPDRFAPLDYYKAQKTMDVTTLSDRCLKSSSLRRTDSDSFGSTFTFHTTGREGAVLVMPDGGLSEDLQNYKLIENYVAANAESWGQYVESEDCGVPTENGIQVVVGTDKVSSWGMATFENVEFPMQFEFASHWTASQTRTSHWKRINGREGPAEEEIQDLLKGPTTQTPLRNQCVFVRTLHVSLSRTVRDRLAVEVCSSCSRPVPTRDEANLGRGNIQIQTSQVGSSISHPLKSLNKYLLENRPNAKIVITRDSHWMSIITENDTTLPSVEEICKRVLGSYHICEENGVVTLEKQEESIPIGTPHPFTITSTADNSICSTSASSELPLSEINLNMYTQGTASASTSLAIGSLHADPTSLPSSPFLSIPSSPRTPRGSPTFAKRLHPFVVRQSETKWLPLSSPRLHQGQSFGYSQQAPHDPAGPVEGSWGPEHSDKADMWKFYCETFKSHIPLPQTREQGFTEKVGSVKTLLASQAKRKDPGKWACPFDGSTFTRKQNLKHHIQSHFGIKEHQCSCGSGFNSVSGLKRHQKKCQSFREAAMAST